MQLKRARSIERIRVLEEDLAKAEWARRMRDANEAEKALVDFRTRLYESRVTGGGAGKVVATMEYITHGLSIENRMRESLIALREAERAAREAWQECRQRREGVGRLVDKIRESEEAALLKNEQNLMDDVVSSRWGRAGSASEITS